MPITLQCSCGNTWQVDESSRGKKARCPACGNFLAVEDPAAAGGDAKSSGSTKRPTRVDGDEADMPEIRKPIRRPSDARRGLLPWMVWGCVALIALGACFFCGGLGLWLAFLRKS